MKKIVLGVVAVLVLAVLAVGLYIGRLVRSLDTPEFKERVARQASASAGTEVKFQNLEISLLRGLRLQGVKVANPAGFRGDFLTADLAALSYRPWSLVSGGRIEVEEIRIDKPQVNLVSNAAGAFNYEKLLAGRAEASAARAAAPPAAGAASLPRLRISRFALEDARIAIVDDKNVAAFRMDDADLTASLGLVAGVAEGTGQAEVAAISLADVLFLRGVHAPIKVTAERMSLSPLKAKLAGGDVSGDIQVLLKPDVGYTLAFEAKGASVATLLKEAGSVSALAGNLAAKASFRGTGGLLTIKGEGRAEIRDCRWPNARLFAVLAGVLQTPELADPRFEECRVEFQVSGGQARTPVVSFKGPQVQLTGAGSMGLVTSVLDYRMNLALAPALVGRIPGTLRAAFKTRPDGFGAVDFKVTGTTEAPKTDLAQSVGTSVAIEAAKGGLGRLFGRKPK